MIEKRYGLTLILLLAVVAGAIGTASAIEKKGFKHYTKQGNFEEVFQDLQDTVVNRGLVIDYTGHVDTMLERTSEAAGSVTKTGNKSPYLHAKYIQFCSAKLTHEAVSANPYNLAICPYVVFAFEAHADPGKIVVGYRRPLPGPSLMTKEAFAKIDNFLEEIVKEATSE